MQTNNSNTNLESFGFINDTGSASNQVFMYVSTSLKTLHSHDTQTPKDKKGTHRNPKKTKGKPKDPTEPTCNSKEV